jgi:hypothetical protein
MSIRIPIFKLKIPNEEFGFQKYEGNFTKVLIDCSKYLDEQFDHEEWLVQKCLLKSLKIFHTLKKNPVKKLLITLSQRGVCDMAEDLFVNLKKNQTKFLTCDFK